ncbi:hypothetical protein [Flavobacterium sp. XS2P39]|uniref:hypothetical protein n=1 Tax=Flavobacterium sp. XS2P39 TaxID=3401725 RepID=UPI003AAF411D
MDQLKHLFILAFLAASNSFAIAQNNISLNESKSLDKSMRESIFLHSNATTFITGETLLYKLYCLNPVNNSTSSISKIAYVELIDQNKQTISKSKIYLENGTGQGDYFIPTTLKTGNYKLVAYTKWNLNNALTNIFKTDIAIINPFQPYQEEGGNKKNSTVVSLKNNEYEKQTSKSANSVFTEKVAFEIDKKSYQTREKVTLKIKSLIEKGNYSIAIRKIDELPTKLQLTAEEFVKDNSSIPNPATTKDSLFFIPELRAELISGSITSKKENADLNDKSVALSLPGESFAFKIAKTNRSGKFTFLLDKNPNQTNCVIQVLEDNRDDYTIHLDELPKFDTSSLLFPSELILTAHNTTAIEERSVANQIENAYYHLKKDSLAPNAKTTPFFHTIEKAYILDDYTRFPTLKETIIEVLIEIYFKKNNDLYSLHLRDNSKDLEIYGLPLVLVDGLAIKDVNELFDINMSTIYKVSLINQGYVYGPNLFSGLISFETKNNNFISKSSGDYIKKIDIQRPTIKKVYFSPDYASGTLSQRIPDYRHQLLWMPELNIAEKENTVSFYTSDVTGNFEIVLEGFTKKGVPISLKKSFEVK